MAAEEVVDERTLAIKNNPCGSCRALGLPICRGHGGGGGGSGDKTSAQDKEASVTPNADQLMKALKLSPLWTTKDAPDEEEVEAENAVFDYNPPESILFFHIDFEKGIVKLRPKPNLSKEDLETYEDFQKAIENELHVMKQEMEEQGKEFNFSIERVGNKVFIRIPNVQQFDLFITRLRDKNFLPTQPQPTPKMADSEKKDLPGYDSDSFKREASRRAPNPFDIDNGPSKT